MNLTGSGRLQLYTRTSIPAYMVGIRVRDNGSAPIVEKGREAPFKQGDYYVFEVKDEVAKYWNKLPPGRRDELSKQAMKQGKDIRVVLDGFVFRPAHTK